MSTLTQLRLLGVAAKHAVKFGVDILGCAHGMKTRIKAGFSKK
jgi:hypothetical protein